MTDFTAREAWLQEAIQLLTPSFRTIKLPVPKNIRVSVGFGPNGARQENSRIMGVTLHQRCSADGSIEIWISPESATSVDMLGTLVHELIHAALNAMGNLDWWEHTGSFARAGTQLGLTGPMTSSVPGPDLLHVLASLIPHLGPYPGAVVTLAMTGPSEPVRASTGPKKQTKSRYLLLKCTEDDQLDCWGYQVRITQKWIDVGLPACPEGHVLSLQD